MNTAQIQVVELALQAMKNVPSSLPKMLKLMAPIKGVAPTLVAPEVLAAAIRDPSRSHPIALVLHRNLVEWDYVEEATWTERTERCSAKRRERIYRLLDVSADVKAAFEEIYPFEPIAPPTTIATEHVPWYRNAGRGSFYWDEYSRHLRDAIGWPEENVAVLNDSTTQVVERLADPFAREVFQSKGLVVGYVQSGKTANFTGVLAKAADSGYRLIVVLAGMLDVLRNQTQRRVDKELIGQELLSSALEGSDYAGDPEWSEFVRHGQPLPSAKGYFDWQRLTGPAQEYHRLGKAASALAFDKKIPGKRLNTPENLVNAPVKLVVVKKNAIVLKRLTGDLERLTAGQRQDIPVLIIDDESDQASIDTRRPTRDPEQVRQRNATNAQIVRLLELLPRSQYVGYTATPFANVLVNPEDEKDIFPKDFIVTLPRPKGYMGVADFFDTDPDVDQKSPGVSNESAFVRGVRGADDEPKNLRRALDTFVLAGALKLYRSKQKPKLRFKHHTMLVHRSPRQKAHEEDKVFVEKQFKAADHLGLRGLKRLSELFEDDFKPVSEVRAAGLPFPKSFRQLLPFIKECVSRLSADPKMIRIVNGENKDDTPNFEVGPVWSILVGGTKLSRGYTVEGLTVSYYRRAAGAADTLMQMGRWFGFRNGYQDLVRLFVGREEGPAKLDLLEAFKSLCRDEEEFRNELTRYASMTEPRITPKMVPPLVPFHMLRPTSPNKMHYAQLLYENFGGRWRDPTNAPLESERMRVSKNDKAMRHLLAEATFQTVELGVNTRKRGVFEARVATLEPKGLVRFLEQYRWTQGDDNVLGRELEYLKGKLGDPEIKDWVLIAPQLVNEAGARWSFGDVAFDVRSRSRETDEQTNALLGRYKVLTEPPHKDVAEFIAGVADSTTKPSTDATRKLKREKRGVMLFYPVRDFEREKNIITMGFALLFPPNHIRTQLKFKVDPEAPFRHSA